jgi:hypothetical protein
MGLAGSISLSCFLTQWLLWLRDEKGSAGAVALWSGGSRKVTRLPGATYDNIVIVIAGAFAYFRNPI